MTKTLAALATCATLVVASVAQPNQAHADGGRITAGVLGGLVAGTIIGGAIAAPRQHYYSPEPVYVAPQPVYEAPSCYWTRGEPMWNGYAWVRPRVQVCD